MASVIKRINEFNAEIPEYLRHIKWKAMEESAFRFYRGTAHIFAQDFIKLYKYKPKIRTWICGDLHFENFGSYKGDNRQEYFDLNDFDESILASPEPEIARFLTCIIIAANEMKASALNIHKTLHVVMEEYITTIINRKALMLEEKIAHGAFKKYFEQLNDTNRTEFLQKRTEKHKGHLKLITDGKHFLPLKDSKKADIYNSISILLSESENFSHFIFEDAAFRIAGTGSLGLERYCILFFSKKKGKNYLIDIKETRKSCFANLIDIKQPEFTNEAIRINTVRNIMQFNSPAFISTITINNKQFVVQELQPLSNKMAISDFGTDFGMFGEVAKEMARLIAYSHLRSSGNYGSSTVDDLQKFASKKQWQRDIIELSAVMAKKNDKYYKQFLKAE